MWSLVYLFIRSLVALVIDSPVRRRLAAILTAGLLASVIAGSASAATTPVSITILARRALLG